MECRNLIGIGENVQDLKNNCLGTAQIYTELAAHQELCYTVRRETDMTHDLLKYIHLASILCKWTFYIRNTIIKQNIKSLYF